MNRTVTTMMLANVGGLTRTAEPGMTGQCPQCAGAVIAKCGQLQLAEAR